MPERAKSSSAGYPTDHGTHPQVPEGATTLDAMLSVNDIAVPHDGSDPYVVAGADPTPPPPEAPEAPEGGDDTVAGGEDTVDAGADTTPA